MSWRDTLFVWRGDYTYRDDPVPGDRPSSSVYEGTWVGVSASDATRAAQPPDADFAKRTAPKFKVWGVRHDPPSIADALRFHDVHHEPSVVIGKGWQLDDGDRGEMRWHDDAVHVVRVHGDSCAAIGKNAFGRFVAAGYLSGYARQVSKDDAFAGYAMTRRKLTLARRYLADDDARARTWRVEDVMACVSDAERRAKADARAASHKPWMTEARSMHWFPYDPVAVVNADP